MLGYDKRLVLWCVEDALASFTKTTWSNFTKNPLFKKISWLQYSDRQRTEETISVEQYRQQIYELYHKLCDQPLGLGKNSGSILCRRMTRVKAQDKMLEGDLTDFLLILVP